MKMKAVFLKTNAIFIQDGSIFLSSEVSSIRSKHSQKVRYLIYSLMMRPMPVAEGFLSQSKTNALSEMKIYLLRMQAESKSYRNIIQKNLKKYRKMAYVPIFW